MHKSSTGFTPLVLSVPRKYYLIQQQKTWSEAQAYCRATHDDLAIIESNDNMVRLQNEAQRQHFSSSAWIGLYDAVNSWCWSMGNETLGSMRLWSSPEPNNYAGIESCGLMYSTGWNDMPCTLRYPFVCFDGKQHIFNILSVEKIVFIKHSRLCALSVLIKINCVLKQQKC